MNTTPLEEKPTLLTEVPLEENSPFSSDEDELLSEETNVIKKPRKPRSPNKPKTPEIAAAELVAHAREATALAADNERSFTVAQRKKLLSNYSKRTLKARFGITL